VTVTIHHTDGVVEQTSVAPLVPTELNESWHV